jgi:plastocyanin
LFVKPIGIVAKAAIACIVTLSLVPHTAPAVGESPENCFNATGTPGGVVDARGHDYVCARVAGIQPYDPAVLVVSPGTTVIWKNSHNLFHTVTSIAGGFDHALEPGQSASQTFSSGATHVFCKSFIHPAAMHGLVVVR